MGYKMGGSAGYGLRRLLPSRRRQPIRILKSGEHKAVTSELVILLPGPRQEVNTVRLMYKLLLDGIRPASLARELNRRCMSNGDEQPWGHYGGLGILRSPKYAGFNVCGKTSSKLRQLSRNLPMAEWIVVPGAFKSIIEIETYRCAQLILDDRAINKSDEDLLKKLKRLLNRHGYLSQKLIDRFGLVPHIAAYEYLLPPFWHLKTFIG